MINKVAVLCPSRGRRQSFQRLLDSFDETTLGLADILLRNGLDDETLAEYDDVHHPNVWRRTNTDQGFDPWPTAGYCYAMQDLWESFPPYAVYSMMEDDCTFADPGWDAALLHGFDQFPNRIGILRWVVDGVTTLAVSHEWTTALGYFMARDLGERAFEGLIALAGDRIAPGPRLHHHPQGNRHGSVFPLWQADGERVALWTKSEAFYRDLGKLEVACSA